jgi:dipeptidase E
MNSPINIIAVGGGGFTHEIDSELEDYIFQQLPVTNPAIGFIPTASGDSEIKITRFYVRISLIVTGCFGHRDRFAAALDTG